MSPEDLRNILLETISEESAAARALTQKQQTEQIKAAKDNGVKFFSLSDAEKTVLVDKAKPAYEKWGEKIGVNYFKKVSSTLQ